MATLEPDLPDDNELRKMLDELDFPPIEEGPVGVKALSNIELVEQYNQVNRSILRDQTFWDRVAAGDEEVIALRAEHDALLVELHERKLR